MITSDDLDELSQAEVQNRRDRGDWIDKAELRVVDSWLRKAAREQKFQEACERASHSAALDARRLAILGNCIAVVALLVAIVALVRG